MRWQTLAWAATGAGAALVLWMNQRSAADVSGKEARAAADRIAALEIAQKRSTTRTRVVEVEREVRAPSADPPVAAPALPQEEEADTAGAARPEERHVYRSDAELATAYAVAFEEERVDRAWAPAAQRAYAAPIEAALPEGSAIRSFECRSAFCRLEVVHESIDVSNAFLLQLFSMEHDGPLMNLTGGFRAAEPTPTSDGKLDYVVYVARPGVALILDPDGGDIE